MPDNKVIDLEAQVSHLEAQVADIAHTNKDLEDELTRIKAKVDQQCDDTAKGGL